MRFLKLGENALIQLNHVVVVQRCISSSGVERGTNWTLLGDVRISAPDITLEQARKAINESVEL